MVDDLNLKYTQFRTLYFRFFTNDMLIKSNLTNSDMCSILGKSKKDSIVHVVLNCIHVCELWDQVCEWIASTGNIVTDNCSIYYSTLDHIM